MKKFHFKGDMAQAFGENVEINVSTFREAIDAFDTIFNGFRKFLVRKSLSGVEYRILSESGDSYEETSLDLLLGCDNYYIVPRPIGAGGALGLLGGMAGNFLMGYGMEWFADQLNPIEETGKEYEIIETNSYIYSSNENIVSQGTPVPLVYGVLRVGSLVIGSSVNNYDYNYDAATIYKFPVNDDSFNINVQKVQGGNHSFIDGQELINLRNQPRVNLADQMHGYDASDSTARKLRIRGANAAKAYNEDQNNTSINENYQGNAGKGGSRVTYGPSVGAAVVPEGGSTDVGAGQGYRPFLFPQVGHKDYEMRPASSDTPCGIRRFIEDGETVTRNISFKGASINNVMTVGSRGKYQKLESIGIYKSLDVLCEGPIAGLANPITGYDQDIHTTSFGYESNLELDVLTSTQANSTSLTVSNLSYSTAINNFTSTVLPDISLSGIVTPGLGGAGNIQFLEPDQTIVAVDANGNLPDNVSFFSRVNILTSGAQPGEDQPEGAVNTDPNDENFGELLEAAGAYTQTPDGVYLIRGDGLIDPIANIYIRPESPDSIGDADIGDTIFGNNDRVNFWNNEAIQNPLALQTQIIAAQNRIAVLQAQLATATGANLTFIQIQITQQQNIVNNLTAAVLFWGPFAGGLSTSSNGHLFLYRHGDGSIFANNNSTQAVAQATDDQILGDQYTSNLLTAQGTNRTYNIDGRPDLNDIEILEFNFTQIAADAAALSASFQTGGGYGSEERVYSVSPNNGIALINENGASNAQTSAFQRKNRAIFTDGGMAREQGFSSIAERTLELLFGSDNNTIPNTNDTWNSMARIQIDDDSQTNHFSNDTFLVQVGRGRNSGNWRNLFIQITKREYLSGAIITVTDNRLRDAAGNVFDYGRSRTPGQDLGVCVRFNIRGNCTQTADFFWGIEIDIGSTNAYNFLASNEVDIQTVFRNSGTIDLAGLVAHSATFRTRAWNAFSAMPGNVQQVNSFPKFVPGSGSNTNTGTPVIAGQSFFLSHMLEGGNNNLDDVSVAYNGSIEYTDTSGAVVRSDYGTYCPMLSPRITVYSIRRYRSPSSLGGGDIQFQVCRTNITAFAIVNAKGCIEGAYLHTVPDNCVLDEQASGIGIGGGIWTPLCPLDCISTPKMMPYYFEGFTFQDEGMNMDPQQYLYQDVGIILECDASNSGQTIKFDVNNLGAISRLFENDDDLAQELFGLFEDWQDHVQFALPFPTSLVAQGVVPDTWTGGAWGAGNPIKTLDILDSGISNTPPTQIATASVPIETVNLNNGRASQYRVASSFGGLGLEISGGGNITATATNLCTGRPLPNITINNAGAGYPTGLGSRVSVDVHNSSFYPVLFNPSGNGTTSNAGYKPDTKFLMFGISRDAALNGKYGAPPIANANNNQLELMCMFASTIVEVTINSEGMVDSIIPIDNGYGYINEQDPIVWLLTNAAYDVADEQEYNVPGTILGNDWASQQPFVNSGATLAGLNLNRLNFNSTDNWLPELNFPKQDLQITVRRQGLNEDTGAIESFYISHPGRGFTPSQIIENPFARFEIENPSLFVARFSNGILRELYIDYRNSSADGYSVIDSDISINISPPPRTTTNELESVAVENNPDSDPNAVYRSIYLNDVPIRDTNDRFNFSRFHFDMRIGNFRNGRNNTIQSSQNANGTISVPERNISRQAQGRILDDEFKVPSNTKFINYPLIGPRNHGKKDYFYSYTIKNPEVTDLCISIKINKLHYIYEGDEEVINLNLVPILGAIIGFYVGQWAVSLIARLIFPDPVFACGCICVGGATAGNPSTGPEIVLAAFIALLVAAGGIAGAVAVMMSVKAFKCKWAPFLCFKIGELIKNSGEIWPAKVRIAIEYGIEGQALNQEYVEIAGCATNPYVKDVYINNLPMPTSWSGNNNDHKANRIFRVYRTTREMDPVTGGLIEARYQIDCELLSITEYVCGFFNYPNTAMIGTRVNSKDMPNIPRREFLVKGKLIRIPSSYSPTGATYQERYPGDGIWNGQFQEDLVFSSNPAWIIWDLLTNKRYGAGKYGITEDQLDKWSFYEFAQYCDQDIEVYIDGVKTNERRHMCNLYIDSTRNAYEYIQDLLKTYDASLNFTAGKFYFIADRSDLQPIMIFNNSNVTEDGFSYSSTPKTHRITACTVDYVDERDNYISKSEYVEDNEGIEKYGYSHVRLTGFGITRKGEAHRMAWQKILNKKIEKELIQFKTGLQGSYLKVGDVVDVIDNNKISQYSGGKITKVEVRTDTIIETTANPDPNGEDIVTEREVEALQLTLDIPASILNNVNYIKIQDFIESGDFVDEDSTSELITGRSTAQFNRYRISNRNGFNIDIVQVNENNQNDPTWNLNATNIAAGFMWIIDDNTEDKIKPKQYRIKSIKESSNLQYEIVGIDYVAEKYEQIKRLTSKGDAKPSTFDDEEVFEDLYYGPSITDTSNPQNPNIRGS